jgi:peptidoglycan/LPS O-acetylase OafA/YrhL
MTETTATAQNKHVRAWSGLRGLAAGGVLLFHAHQYAGGPQAAIEFAGLSIPLHALAATGFLGVDLFFVLSGFLLAQPFLRAASKDSPWPAFWPYIARRAKRVLPAFWVQLVLLALVAFAAGNPVSVKAFFAVAFFMQHMLGVAGQINSVYWTLPLEWWFYFLLPLLCLSFRYCPWWVFLCAAISWGVAYRLHCQTMLAEGNIDGVFGYGSIMHLNARIDQFSLGVVAAYAQLRIKVTSPWRARAAYVGVLLYFALVLNLYPRGDLFVRADYPYLLGHYPLVGLIMSLLIFGCGGKNWLSQLLSLQPIAWLGQISYSLYLWHMPMLVLSKSALLTMPPLYATLIAVIASIVVATISERWIERPFIANKLPNPYSDQKANPT